VSRHHGGVPRHHLDRLLRRLPMTSASTTAHQFLSTNTAPTTTKEKPAQVASLLDDYGQLSKARLSALVVTTTAAGFVAAGVGPLDTLAAVCTGTGLCSASAAGFNHIFEQDRDKKMKRTQRRPLVRGTMSVGHAAAASTTWGIAGTTILALGTDPTTTALGVGNILLYSGLYTYLKPRSVLNTWVGAVVGAIPPVMGYAAATGGTVFELEAVLLGATLFYWQLPHFLALSYMHRVDYKRGGFRMLPDFSEGETANQMVRNAWYLSAIPVVATLSGVTSSMFCLEGLLLNGYAIKVATDFRNDRTNAKARKVFLTSLWYLPCTLMLFLLHSKTWDEKQLNKNFLREYIAYGRTTLREAGRQLCLHETQVAKAGPQANACPVVVTQKKSKNAILEQQTALTTTAAEASTK